MIIDAKNYRGITITPTLSKIIETIIKFRINPTILSVQNSLQRGFTEHSTPLISSLMLEEVGRENKDNKKPTIIECLMQNPPSMWYDMQTSFVDYIIMESPSNVYL